VILGILGVLILGTTSLPQILRDEGGDWKIVFEESGNWRRFRRYKFPLVSTSKIRLEILKAKNSEQERLYEIRAYHER
jgi:hypothetical protein